MNPTATANIREHAEHSPEMGKRVFIDPSAVVSGNVQIGDNSSIWPMTVVRGDMHSILIGARTSVQDGSVLHITHAGPYNPGGWPLSIGDDCTIGHKVVLHGCQLGHRILVGIGAIVMDGAIIEDEVVIGANSLVPPNKHLESGFLYLGSPVKKVRALTQKELDYFVYVAKNYVDLKEEHLLQLGLQD